jgi:hypothetical protein
MIVEYKREASRQELIERIEELEKEIEERDKYNITTLPFEELKEMIEQNKNIFIFGKEYISKDKIREKIKELEDYMILFTNDKEKFNRYKYARNTLEKLLKENNND